MTIKLECVLKHVKKDYSEIWGGAIKVLALVVGFVAVIGIIFTVGYLSFQWAIEAYTYAISLCTAFNFAAASVFIILYYVTLNIAIFWDKDSFVRKHITDANTTEIIPILTHEIVLFASFCNIAVLVYYRMCTMLVSDVVGVADYGMSYILIFLAAEFIILFITPICCAIARCRNLREEPPFKNGDRL